MVPQVPTLGSCCGAGSNRTVVVALSVLPPGPSTSAVIVAVPVRSVTQARAKQVPSGLIR